MRNLKRALSLTLASVMLLGMMVIGSSAAQGYDDVAETDNVEAIEVLQAIKVMVGDERGFGPERPVNRAEMAVVMALLLNLDYDYYVSSCPFGDVYDWARGPVGACYANGIVSGRGDGVYDPGATVTAVEAASMLMRALGYFRYQNDYEGNFVLSTVKQGTKIGIFDGVGSSADTPMTRNQVAQMVLNALQTGMVEPDGNTLNLATPDGNIYTGKVNYVNVTSNKDFARAISSVRASSMGSANDSPIVELGEQLYNGELKLKSDDLDAFGRPSRTWEFKGKAIGTYMKKELLDQEYTVKVTGKDLYEEIGKATLEDKDYDFYIYIDGVNAAEAKTILGGSHFTIGDLNKNNKSGVGATGNGVLTQVFIDSDAKEVTIAIINTYLAKATADYNEKKEEATLEVFAIDNKGDKSNPVYVKEMTANKTDSEKLDIAAEDFEIAKDIKDGDFFLVNVAEGEIQIMKDPEIMSAVTVTSFSKNDYVVTDGTQYDYAHPLEYDPEVLEDWTNGGSKINLKDRQYNLYLDTYGYVLGVDLVDDPDNYLFITGVDGDTSNLAATNFKANAIFLDGTMQTIEVNAKKSTFNRGAWEGPLVNRWFTYTVNTSTNLYTVNEVNDVIRTTDDNGSYVVDPDTVRINTNGTAQNGAGSKWLGSSDRKLAQFATKDLDKVNPNNWDDFGGVQANDSAEYKIGLKRVSLPAIGSNGSTSGKPFSLVYGNDATVYLTAKVETINARQIGQVGVISDVDNVTVGVKNADLTTYTLDKAKAEANKNAVAGNTNWNAVTAAYGAYSLYKDNGYIVATVVVGEDSAAVKNLVYTHTDDVKMESYDSTTDQWTWTRKVIYNGEEIEIKEVGDQLSQLGAMEQFNWYQIKLNGKDEVTSVQLAEKALDNYKGSSAYVHEGFEYADDIAKVEPCVLEKDTVLYEKSMYNNEYPALSSKPNAITSNKLPSLKVNTLYAETEAKTGFHVRDDVKVVLIQSRNNEKNKVFFDEGVKELEEIISQLNPNVVGGVTNYSYEISAILTGGDASVVIIRDLFDDGYVPDTGSDHHRVTATYDKYHTFTITINDGCTPNNVEIAAAIRYELETNHSASNVDVKFKDNKVEEVSWTAPGGERITLTVTSGNLTIRMFRQVKVNDKNVPITAGTKWSDLLSGFDAAYFTQYPWLKLTDWNGNTAWYQYASIAAGDVDVDITTPNSNPGNIDWVEVETGYMAQDMNEALAKAAIETAKQATSEILDGTSSSNGGDGKLPSGCKGAPAGVDVEVRNGTVYVSGTWAPGASTSYTWGAGTGWGFDNSLYNDSTHFLVPYVYKIPEGAKSMRRTSPDSRLYDYSSWSFDQDVMGFMVSKDSVTRGYAESKVLWYADAAGTILMGESIIRIDLSNLNGGKAGTTIGSGVSNTTVSSSTTLDQVKALTPGSHVLSEIPTALTSDVHGTAAQNIFFVYKTNDSAAATTNTVATLTITAADGTVMYAETLTVSSNGNAEAGHVFYVQVTASNNSDYPVNAEEGYPMSRNPLPAGTYTWTISGTNVLGSNGGQFTIQ